MVRDGRFQWPRQRSDFLLEANCKGTRADAYEPRYPDGHPLLDISQVSMRKGLRVEPRPLEEVQGA